MIADWEGTFEGLYGQANEGRPIEQIWVAVMAQCSELGEGLRKGNLQEILVEAADVFEWLCTFVSALRSGRAGVFREPFCLSRTVSLKYPGVCGRCYGVEGELDDNKLPEPSKRLSLHCVCPPRKMEGTNDKPVAYGRAYRYNERANTALTFDEFTILDWQRVFDRTFERNAHFSTIEMIGYHFLEEAGEVAVAVRHLSQLRRAADIPEMTGLLVEWGTDVGKLAAYCDAHDLTRKEKLDYTALGIDPLLDRVAFGKIHVLLELGDMFSWLCSLLNKMEASVEQNVGFFKYVADLYGIHSRARAGNLQPPKAPREQVREKLMQTPLLQMQLERTYYPNGSNQALCPTCRRPVCGCHFLQTDKDVRLFSKK
jgi:NTP pyrophosphatase (non-canonical NTP hydrolase)